MAMNNFESLRELISEGGQEKKGRLAKEYKGFEIYEVMKHLIHPSQQHTPFYVYETVAGYTHLMFLSASVKEAKKKIDEWMERRAIEKKEKEENDIKKKRELENRIANREKEGMTGSIGVRDSGVNRWGQGRNAVRGSGNGGSGLMWK